MYQRLWSYGLMALYKSVYYYYHIPWTSSPQAHLESSNPVWLKAPDYLDGESCQASHQPSWHLQTCQSVNFEIWECMLNPLLLGTVTCHWDLTRYLPITSLLLISYNLISNSQAQSHVMCWVGLFVKYAMKEILEITKLQAVCLSDRKGP